MGYPFLGDCMSQGLRAQEEKKEVLTKWQYYCRNSFLQYKKPPGSQTLILLTPILGQLGLNFKLQEQGVGLIYTLNMCLRRSSDSKDSAGAGVIALQYTKLCILIAVESVSGLSSDSGPSLLASVTVRTPKPLKPYVNPRGGPTFEATRLQPSGGGMRAYSVWLDFGVQASPLELIRVSSLWSKAGE